MRPRPPVVSLEARLKKCKNVITLGVRTNWLDYGKKERRMIREAEVIYYPTLFYADLFDAAGKTVFPSYHTYKCVQDKIKQTALFDYFNIPHPKTRVYYGRRTTKRKILSNFSFPFIAKVPRGSALGEGVFLIENGVSLDRYLENTHVAYIQEYLPSDRDVRVVIIGTKAVHAYWRIAGKGEFRTNLSQGGRIDLDDIPSAAVSLALYAAGKCRFNDVGMDVLCHKGRFYVLEANMKYGKEGFRIAGIDYPKLMEELIARGEI